MIELKAEKRNLMVQLTTEEVLQRANLAAEAADAAGQAETRANLLGEQAKQAKKEAELKSKEAGRYLAIYRAREESQQVPCRANYSPVTDEVVVVRLDTFEIVEKRKPTQEDSSIIAAKRQDAFDFAKPKRVLKPEKGFGNDGIEEEDTDTKGPN